MRGRLCGLLLRESFPNADLREAILRLTGERELHLQLAGMKCPVAVDASDGTLAGLKDVLLPSRADSRVRMLGEILKLSGVPSSPVSICHFTVIGVVARA